MLFGELLTHHDVTRGWSGRQRSTTPVQHCVRRRPRVHPQRSRCRQGRSRLFRRRRCTGSRHGCGGRRRRGRVARSTARHVGERGGTKRPATPGACAEERKKTAEYAAGRRRALGLLLVDGRQQPAGLSRRPVATTVLVGFGGSVAVRRGGMEVGDVADDDRRRAAARRCAPSTTAAVV